MPHWLKKQGTNFTKAYHGQKNQIQALLGLNPNTEYYSLNRILKEKATDNAKIHHKKIHKNNFLKLYPMLIDATIMPTVSLN